VTARAISSRAALIAAVGVAILVVVAVVSSGVFSSTASRTESTGVSTSGTTTATSTNSSSSVATSSSNSLNESVKTTNSTVGLELLLSVNSTTIPSEDSVDVSASVINTRPTPANVSASSHWPIQGLVSGLCDFGPGPVGIAFFRGYYGMNNLSSAMGINVWPPVGCPASDFLNATSFLFLPNSDVANYSGYFGSHANSTRATRSTLVTVDASPYAANDTGLYFSLGSALPSTYTLAAGDEWGQIVLLHFNVVKSDLLPKVGNFLASGGGCGGEPCITNTFSGALVFDCAAAAATPSGCSVVWSSGVKYSEAPIVNYTVTAWFPSYGQTDEPVWANCMYSSWPVGALGQPTSPPSFGYCFMTDATAFVVSLPGH